MTDTQALGIGAITVPNPHNDDITVAQSKVDVMQRRLDQVTPELDRLNAKLTKTEGECESIKSTIADITAGEDEHKANLASARADLDAARQADPDGAVAHDGRRDRERAQRRAELEAELAALNTTQEG